MKFYESIYLPISFYLPFLLPIHIPTYLSIDRSTYVSLTHYLSTSLSIFLCLCQIFVSLSFSLSLCLSYLSLSLYPSACLSTYVSMPLPLSLSLSRSLALSLSRSLSHSLSLCVSLYLSANSFTPIPDSIYAVLRELVDRAAFTAHKCPSQIETLFSLHSLASWAKGRRVHTQLCYTCIGLPTVYIPFAPPMADEILQSATREWDVRWTFGCTICI